MVNTFPVTFGKPYAYVQHSRHNTFLYFQQKSGKHTCAHRVHSENRKVFD